MLIIPAILTDNPQEFEQLLRACDGVVDRVQIDVNDGSFLEEKSFLPEEIPFLENNIYFDFHLMVKEPIHWLERCARLGGDRVFAHIEGMSSQASFVKECQIRGLKIGLALDIDTPVSLLDPLVLEDLDAVLLMGYSAGKGGQKFDELVFDKVQELVELRKNDISPFRICVDGGVWEENMFKLYSLGVDEVAVGRRLFDGDLSANIKRLEGKIV